ncbi:hypothetical protein [Microtetraspora sp. NBRC 13810]|uniref:AraC-like ligand-binding domain-containing protein n=1 Tax=Microtetraspora sp. NBRC 13810 TaxID=3030990 RepID=UPI003331B735
MIAASQGEYLQLCLLTRGTGVVLQDGRSALLSPGQFALHDTTRPYTWNFTDRFQTMVFRVSRRAVGLSEAELRRITAVMMRTDRGLAGTVLPFLSGLASDPVRAGVRSRRLLLRRRRDARPQRGRPDHHRRRRTARPGHRHDRRSPGKL